MGLFDDFSSHGGGGGLFGDYSGGGGGRSGGFGGLRPVGGSSGGGGGGLLGLIENFVGGDKGVLPTFTSAVPAVIHAGGIYAHDLTRDLITRPAESFIHGHPGAAIEHLGKGAVSNFTAGIATYPESWGGRDLRHAGQVLVPQQAEAYKQKYFTGHALHNIYEDPFGTALDATFVLSVLGKGARAAATAGRANGVIGEGGRLGRITEPARSLSYTPEGSSGLTVQRDWASTIQGRLWQDAADRFGARHENWPIVGNASRVTRQVKRTERRTQARDSALPIFYDQALTKLTPDEIRVLPWLPELRRDVPNPIEDKINYFDNQLRQTADPRKRVALSAQIKSLEAIDPEVVRTASPQLIEANDLQRQMGQRATLKGYEKGTLDPLTVAERAYLPHRLDTGAEQVFASKVKTRPGDYEYQQHIQEIDQLEKQIADHERQIERAYRKPPKVYRGTTPSHVTQAREAARRSRLLAKRAEDQARKTLKPHETPPTEAELQDVRERLATMRASVDAMPPGERGAMKRDIARQEKYIRRYYEGNVARERFQAAAEGHRKAAAEHENVIATHEKELRRQASLKRELRLRPIRENLENLRQSRASLGERGKRPAEQTVELPFEFRGGMGPAELASREAQALRGELPSGIDPRLGSSYRVPHMALENKVGFSQMVIRRFLSRPSKLPALMHNQGVAYAAGQVARTPEIFTRDYFSQMKYLHAQDMIDEVMIPLSREIDLVTGKEANEYYLRTRPGATIPGTLKRSHAATRESVGAIGESEQQFTDWAHQQVLAHKPEDMTLQEMHDAGIRRIPESVAKMFEKENRQANKFERLFWDRALDVWKFIQLGLKPAWSVFNAQTNAIFYALRYGGQGASRAFLKALLTVERGPDKVIQIGRWTKRVPTVQRKVGRLVREYLPAAELGGFSRSQLLPHAESILTENWQLTKLAKTAKYTGKAISYASGYRAVRAFGRANYRFNQASENLFRDAATIVTAKRMSQRLGAANDTLEQLLKKVGDDPALADKLFDEVNKGMGDFANLGPTERNIIRRYAFPFYSWFKTVLQVTGRLYAERPGRMLLLHNLGISAANDPWGGLPFVHPEWMNGLIPIGQEQNGAVPALQESTVNPFQTPVDIAHSVQGVLTDSGSSGSQNPANLLGPIPSAFIQGLANKDLFYGGDYYGPGDKGFGPLPASPATRFVGSLLDLPQARTIDQLRGKYHSKAYQTPSGSSPIPGLNEAQAEALAQYLGFNIRRVNRRYAENAGG